jgi:hypothetical protein
MKAHQPTIILCYPADEADWWFTQGNTRAIAERTYLMAIARDKARPPLYRIICQFKVDQHEAYELQSTRIH